MSGEGGNLERENLGGMAARRLGLGCTDDLNKTSVDLYER